MASFNVVYDSSYWVMVPFEFPTAAGESAQQWASREAEEQRQRGYRQTAKSGMLDDYFVGRYSST